MASDIQVLCIKTALLQHCTIVKLFHYTDMYLEYIDDVIGPRRHRLRRHQLRRRQPVRRRRHGRLIDAARNVTDSAYRTLVRDVMVHDNNINGMILEQQLYVNWLVEISDVCI